MAKNAHGRVDGVGHSTICLNQIFYLAVLAPLFPTFTLISHLLVGTQRSTEDLKVALV
ncbi:GlpM family protein [Psychrobacter arcticus]|uniref:GlpM family protein n=1 Tax=Psychrobacter arcticus TaxID=334543 RepID=UPI000312530B|nr:GlpM family protein [Psychrobacter arcticus]